MHTEAHAQIKHTPTHVHTCAHTHTHTHKQLADSTRIHDDAVQLVQVFPVGEDVEEARGEHRHHVRRQGQQEEEEVAVVAAADAVVDPGAVVVKVLPGGTHGGETRRV